MKRTGSILIVLGLLALLAAPIVAGGVGSVDPVFRLILGITEGPDPIPQIIWTRQGSTYPSLLNFGSVADGRPDTAKLGTRPLVVWAYRTHHEHDIAFTQWTGARWRPVQLLTNGFPDELDPRIYAEEGGTAHIVWWANGAETVWHLSGNPGVWGLPREVAVGRRPSVGAWDGLVRIAYERDANPFGQEIVLATPNGGGTYAVAPVFVINRTERLDVVLHAENGGVWMDWKHSDSEMAYSVLSEETGWADPITVAWPDPSWTGTRQIREMIRQLVEAP